MIRSTMRRVSFLTLCTLGLSWGCAPATREGARNALTSTLTALQEEQAAHAVGALRGRFFFSGPDAVTRFTDWAVSLIPLTSDIEVAVTRAHEAYLADRRTPLAPKAVQERWALLDQYVHSIKQRGYGTLIRLTTTDPKEAGFAFADVPAGRWLLVAALTTRISAVYWAVPLEIQAGETLTQDLTETNIWLEGLQ